MSILQDSTMQQLSWETLKDNVCHARSHKTHDYLVRFLRAHCGEALFSIVLTKASSFILLGKIFRYSCVKK